MSRVATNSFWLLMAQIGGLFIPLIELPILARALNQQTYGQVLYALGIALIASVFVEFGFTYSAARKLIQAKEDRKVIGQLVTNVMVAKTILGIAVLFVVTGVVLTNSGATAIPDHWLVWIALSVIAFGFSPMWYYIGIERIIFPALLDLGLRSIGLLLIVLMVSKPEHATRALAIQACIGIANTLIPTMLMLRRTGVGKVDINKAWNVLRESFELFLYKSSQSIMGSLASTLLGFFGGGRTVGAFVPAEKLVRAASGLVVPIFNAAFPYFVQAHSESKTKARKTVKLTLISLGSITALFSLLTVWLAPYLINLVFGPAYSDSVFILKTLIWIVPLRVCSMGLAILWFIPMGKEHISSKAMLLNIVIASLLAIYLVPSMGGLGMAIALMSSEIIMFGLLFLLFYKRTS